MWILSIYSHKVVFIWSNVFHALKLLFWRAESAFLCYIGPRLLFALKSVSWESRIVLLEALELAHRHGLIPFHLNMVRCLNSLMLWSRFRSITSYFSCSMSLTPSHVSLKFKHIIWHSIISRLVSRNFCEDWKVVLGPFLSYYHIILTIFYRCLATKTVTNFLDSVGS